MRTVKIRNKFIIIFAACFVVCIAYCAWIMYSFYLSGDSLTISILPIAYFLVLGIAISMNTYLFKNFAFLLLAGAFFMRMVVYPVMVVMGGITLRYANVHLLSNITSAVALQIYEYIVCVVGAVLWIKENPKKNFTELKIINIQKCVIFPLIAVAIIGCILYPSVLGRFKFLFQANSIYEAEWRRNLAEIKSNLSAGVYYVFYWFLNVLRFAVLYFALIVIKERSTGKKQFSYIILSLILSTSIIVYTGDDRAAGVFALFAYVMLLSKLYPAYEQKIIKIALYGFVIIVAIVLLLFPILKLRNANETTNAIFSYMNYFVNAYFGGTINIAAALDMEPLKVSTFFGDIVHNIPLLGGFFPELSYSTAIFNSTLGADIINAAQIVPNIGLGVSYLGFLFSPIFSLVLLRLGLKYYGNKNNTFQYLIGMIAMLYCILGIVCYNLFLVMFLLIQYILPLRLLEYLTRKFKFKMMLK